MRPISRFCPDRSQNITEPMGEQWEDTSVVTTDTEEQQNRTSRIYTAEEEQNRNEPTQRCVIDTCVPTNTEEDNVTLCPLIDCLSKRKSNESPEVDMLNNDRDSQLNETEECYSDQELTTDESSCEEYEPNDLQHMSVMRDPVDPPGMSHQHRQNWVQQCEDGSLVWTETDGGNSDICNLADFSSE